MHRPSGAGIHESLVYSDALDSAQHPLFAMTSGQTHAAVTPTDSLVPDDRPSGNRSRLIKDSGGF